MLIIALYNNETIIEKEREYFVCKTNLCNNDTGLYFFSTAVAYILYTILEFFKHRKCLSFALYNDETISEKENEYFTATQIFAITILDYIFSAPHMLIFSL
jgi:hypothetical protein